MAQLHHISTYIWVSIGSGNGLLHDGTKTLPESRITYHQRCSVAFTWEQSHKKCPWCHELNPLLFLLYTNDMPNCLPESHKTRLFADDSNIFITSQSPYTLKNELKIAMGRILRWLEDNKLTVNLNKTQYSIFQTENMNIPDWLNNIKINNNTIKRVHSARFLGIILDEKLKWDDHVKQLSESLTQIINAFKIIKNYVPENKKRMLYYAYIYSRIQYGIEMYGTASKKLIKKVQTKQNRAIKVSSSWLLWINS